jgi:hypothetical protein
MDNSQVLGYFGGPAMESDCRPAARLAAYLDLEPIYAAANAGAKSLGSCLFCREACRKALGRPSLALAVGLLGGGEHTIEKALAEAFHGLLNTRNFHQVDTAANDHAVYQAIICLPCSIQPGALEKQSPEESMLIRVAFATFLGIAVSLPGLAQTSSTESQTLQAILAEVRGIHDDIRVTQTSQILLAELGMQQNVVTRALQRVDDARSKLAQIQVDEKHATGDMERLQDQLNQSSDSAERKRNSENIERLENDLATLKLKEQQGTTSLQQAQEQLRGAQETLDGTQSELNDIVKRMHPAHE